MSDLSGRLPRRPHLGKPGIRFACLSAPTRT